MLLGLLGLKGFTGLLGFQSIRMSSVVDRRRLGSL